MTDTALWFQRFQQNNYAHEFYYFTLSDKALWYASFVSILIRWLLLYAWFDSNLISFDGIDVKPTSSYIGSMKFGSS